MSYKSFQDWVILEKKDIFGFDYYAPNGDKGKSSKSPPLHRIKVEEVISELLTNNLGAKEAYSRFNNSIQWGIGSGSIYMEVSPLGSFKGIVRRLSNDAEGTPIWICKKVMPFYDYLNAETAFDRELAKDLIEKIKETDETKLESPDQNYDDLEDLTIKIAEDCQLNMPEMFIYRGIKMVQENHYIIFFELKGQGIEAPGSTRIEQHHIQVSFNKKKGYIKIFNNDIQSPTKGREWLPAPSEFEEYFFPNQPINEISECVAAALSTY